MSVQKEVGERSGRWLNVLVAITLQNHCRKILHAVFVNASLPQPQLFATRARCRADFLGLVNQGKLRVESPHTFCVFQ
jgi:hypothetical protein